MTDYKNLNKFQKSQINGLTKHLASFRFSKDGRDMANGRIIDRALELGLQIDYNDSGVPGEKFTFIKPRKITSEQTMFGKAWLKQYFFKLDGQARAGKRTEWVSKKTLDIAFNVSRFEFIGVLGLAGQDWGIHSFIPIYRAFDRQGNYFDYSPVHWGKPVIMEG